MLSQSDLPEASQLSTRSPARATLSGALEALQGARSRLEQVHRPLSALERVLIAAESAEAAELRAEIGRLLAAPGVESQSRINGDHSGEALLLAPELPEAEQRLAKLAEGAADAGHRLAVARGNYTAAAEHVRLACKEWEEALWPAAAEAADPDLAKLEDAVRTVLIIESRLRGLILALREAGNRDGPGANGAFAAAESIETRITETRRRPVLAVSIEIGRSFLDRLRSDPGATL